MRGTKQSPLTQTGAPSAPEVTMTKTTPWKFPTAPCTYIVFANKCRLGIPKMCWRLGVKPTTSPVISAPPIGSSRR